MHQFSRCDPRDLHPVQESTVPAVCMLLTCVSFAITPDVPLTIAIPDHADSSTRHQLPGRQYRDFSGSVNNTRDRGEMVRGRTRRMTSIMVELAADANQHRIMIHNSRLQTPDGCRGRMLEATRCEGCLYARGWHSSACGSLQLSSLVLRSITKPTNSTYNKLET